MQAMWALIVSCGNVLVIIVIQIRSIERKVRPILTDQIAINLVLTNDIVVQATEFFVFAGIMGAATTIFAVLASHYVYADSVTDNINVENHENCTSSKKPPSSDNAV